MTPLGKATAVFFVGSVSGFAAPAPKLRHPVAKPLNVPSDFKWKAALLGVTMCWGTNFATIKYALPADEASASLFVATRFALASLALSPWLTKCSSQKSLLAGARVGGWCALGYAAQAYALHLGASASTTAFECSLQTVVVACATAFFARQAPKPTTVAAVGLAVAGVAALCLSGEQSTLLGDAAALGQAVGFGASYIELDACMRRYPNDALPCAAIQCAVIALGASAAAFGQGADLLNAPFWHDTGALVSLVWLGLVSTAFTIWLQALAFKQVPATDASIILTSEPLWAALFASALLGEHLGVNQLAGGAAILAACAVNDGLLPTMPPTMNRRQKPKRA